MAGVPRSGTTFTSAVLGAHPALHRIRFEVRFHAITGGLADAVEGVIPVDLFVRRMRGRLYRSERRGRDVGLHRVVERSVLESALDRFREAFDQDRNAAAGGLIADLLDPAAGDGDGWVEHTPETVRVAGVMARALPDAHLVHCVRDGRDVASSVAARSWGPATTIEGMRWWCRGIRAAAVQLQAWPADRLVTVEHGRFQQDGPSESMLASLGLSPDDGPSRFFESERGDPHIGRWQDEPDATALDAAYRASRAFLRETPGGEAIDAVLGAPEDPPDDLERHLHEQTEFDRQADEDERALIARLVR